MNKRKRVTFDTNVLEHPLEPVSDEEEVEVAGEGGASAADLSSAAAQRAQQRQHLSDSIQQAESQSVLDDAADAEEDDPETAFNEEGIPFEPFHLHREREEGYFDAEGNYVSYRTDVVKDAWLDTLGEGTANEALTNPIFKPARHAEDTKGKAPAAQPEPELDEDDLLNLKRRMLDLLWPAETALDALRRLGGQQGAGSASRADALPWKKALKRGGLRRHEGVQDRVSRAAEGGATADLEQHAHPVDMDTDASPAVLPASQSAGSGRAITQTVPPENRASFDRLTELSSILVNHGDLLVHSKSRERLQREVDRAENGALEAVLRLISRGAGPSSGAASSGGATGTESDASASGRPPAAHEPAAEAPASMESMLDAAVAACEAGLQVAPNQDVSEADPAADPGNDIFGGPTASNTAAQDKHDVAASASEQAQTASLASPSGQAQTKMLSTDAAAIPVQSAPESSDDFTFDENTGTWYSQEQGYFWDAARQLYGDASSGQWYSWNSSNNAYEAVA
eukprot:jgi/Astpho2/3074/Aster-x0561